MSAESTALSTQETEIVIASSIPTCFESTIIPMHIQNGELAISMHIQNGGIDYLKVYNLQIHSSETLKITIGGSSRVQTEHMW